jgi:pimeloyl-ACP methyl ester carboxylesterase
MPITNIRGVDIRYEILGDRGPFVVLQPGGRRGLVSVKPLGEKIAEAGYRVIVYDRRNTGASGVAIEGDSENDVWADDLHEYWANSTRSRPISGAARRAVGWR